MLDYNTRVAFCPRCLLACALLTGCYSAHSLDGDAGATSSDGTWLTYGLDEDGDGARELLVARLPDGHRVSLGVHRIGHAAWAPVGRRFAMMRRDSEGIALELVELGPEGVRERRVLDRMNPGPSGLAWSMDGRWLAYLAPLEPRAGRLLGHAVRVVDVEGGPPLTLLEEGLELELVWSPRAPHLAYATVDELFLVDVGGGRAPRRVELPEGIHSPRLNVESSTAVDLPWQGWSPDGRHLAFLARTPRPGSAPFDVARLYLTSAEATSARLLSPILEEAGSHLYQVRWSPSSDAVVYQDVAEVPDGRREVRAQLVVKLAGGEPTPPVEIARGISQTRFVGVDRLVVVDNGVGAVVHEVTLVDGGAPVVRPLFTSEARCTDEAIWPGGLRVAMICGRSGASELVLVDEEGVRARVSIGGGRLDDRGWAPAGDELVFVEGAPRRVHAVTFPDDRLRPLSAEGTRSDGAIAVGGIERWSANGRYHAIELGGISHGLAVRDRESGAIDVLVPPEPESGRVRFLGFENRLLR